MRVVEAGCADVAPSGGGAAAHRSALRRTVGRGGVEPSPRARNRERVAAAALGTGLLPATEAGTIVTLGPKPLARPGRASTSAAGARPRASRRTVGVRVAVSSSGIATAASRRTAGVPAAGTAQSVGQARLCWCAGPDSSAVARRIGAVGVAAPSARAGRLDAGADGAPTTSTRRCRRLQPRLVRRRASCARWRRGRQPSVRPVLPTVAGADGGGDDCAATMQPRCVGDEALRVAAGLLDAVDAAARRTGASARAAAGAAPAAGSAGRPGARLTPVGARRWIDTAGRISPSWRSPRWP